MSALLTTVCMVASTMLVSTPTENNPSATDSGNPHVEAVFTRNELPWLHISLAVPRGDVYASLLPLVAALVREPSGWHDGPVAELLSRGGAFEAQAHPDGIVIWAEGPQMYASILEEAIRAPLRGLDVTELSFSRAQGQVLRQQTTARADLFPAAKAELWAHWYGRDISAHAFSIDDLKMHQLSASAVTEAWNTMRQEKQLALFYEGRVIGQTPEIGPEEQAPPTDAGVSASPAPQESTSATTLQSVTRVVTSKPLARRTPREPIPPQKTPLLHTPSIRSYLLIGQPLPPSISSGDPVAQALAIELQYQLQDFGEVTVDVDAHQDGSLLLIYMKVSEDHDVNTLGDVIQQHLIDARAKLSLAHQVNAASRKRTAERAKHDALIGQRAKDAARVYLQGAPQAKQGELQPSVEQMKALLMPEIFRAVILKGIQKEKQPALYGPSPQ